MAPMSVVMLGSSHGRVPTIPMGVYGASFGATQNFTLIQGTAGEPRPDDLYQGDDGKTYDANFNPVTVSQGSTGGAVTKPTVKSPILTAAEGALADVIKLLPNAANDVLRAQLISKGYAPAVADKALSNRFNLSANMPWIILGGAALVAVLFMVGSRRRA